MQTPPRPRISFLSPPQCEQFDAWGRRILTEKGWHVESRRLRKELEAKGCEHDDAEEIVRPTGGLLDRFLAELKDRAFRRDTMRFHTGGYPTHYLDHRDGRLRQHTRSSVLDLMNVGEKLDVVGHVSAPGHMCDVPSHARPFHTKALVWEYGRKTSGSFEFTRADQYPLLKELTRRYAELKGLELKELLYGGAFRDYPLVFSKEKCELFYCFRDEGFSFGFSSALPVRGLQAPVTFAGAIVASLIDSLTTALFQYLYDGTLGLSLATPTVLDMTTAIPRRAAPESLKLLLGLSSMADHYGASGLGCHGFRSQAKAVMSFQNGAERIGHLMAAYFCGATSCGAMGSVSDPDSISSLAQLVLDAEAAAQIEYYLEASPIDDDAAAMDLFLDDPYRLNFIDKDHTARLMREEMHLSDLFVGGEKYEDFFERGGRDEYSRACRKVDEFLTDPLPSLLTREEADYLQDAVRRAEIELA